MSADISRLGSLGIQNGILVSGDPGGGTPYVIDWSPVQTDKFWIVEAASLIYQSSVTPAPPDIVMSGLFCAPANSTTVQDPQHITDITPADVSDRGLKLPVNYQQTTFALIGVFSIVLMNRIFIPNGYKLRAVVTLNNNSVGAADKQFVAQAMVRILDYDECKN